MTYVLLHRTPGGVVYDVTGPFADYDDVIDYLKEKRGFGDFQIRTMLAPAKKPRREIGAAPVRDA